MSRPLRVEYPGAVYHITSRGNERKSIFKSDGDRQLFLNILYQINCRFHWLCHSYALMDNHYHLLIETPEPNLSRGMRQLNGVFTQDFNRIHQRVGHLFQRGKIGSGLEKTVLFLLDSASSAASPLERWVRRGGRA